MEVEADPDLCRSALQAGAYRAAPVPLTRGRAAPAGELAALTSCCSLGTSLLLSAFTLQARAAAEEGDLVLEVFQQQQKAYRDFLEGVKARRRTLHPRLPAACTGA